MTPERKNREALDERLRVRWQTVVTVVLLAIALGISVAAGHLVDGVIIGLMLIAGLSLIAGVTYLRRRASVDRH